MRKPIILSVSAALLWSACANPATTANLSADRPGFALASDTARNVLRKDTVWLQSDAEVAANAKRVHGLTHKKTISADTAVQVALLNNRGLQADYADLGLSAAEAWQATMQPNPTVSIGVLGIGAEGLRAFRAIEGLIANNILSIATQNKRNKIADIRFRQAQLRAADETLRVANDTRMAWVETVAAFEAAGLMREAESTADAASALAARLGETGF